MPELPEVETVRRGLLPVLRDRCILDVAVRRTDLRRPLPDGFARNLTGRTIQDIERRGKYLLIRLDRDLVWITHLGMSGRFRIEGTADAATEIHDHVRVTVEGGSAVIFHDPRRFGLMDLVSASDLPHTRALCALGPDPLSDAFTADFLVPLFAMRFAPLKAVLLDQRVVAGMGNIYASESLFRARLLPTRSANTVDRPQVNALVVAIREVFEDAIAAGGSSLRDHRQPSGELGYFQHRFAVYGREGQRCPDGCCEAAQCGGIARIVQSGRSTYFCAHQQR